MLMQCHLTQSDKQHLTGQHESDNLYYALHQNAAKNLSAPATTENRPDLGSNKSQAVGIKNRLEGARKHL